jgi:hypothetical protein
MDREITAELKRNIFFLGKIKVDDFLSLTKRCYTHVQGEHKNMFRAVLASPPGGGEWSVSRPGPINPRETAALYLHGATHA